MTNERIADRIRKLFALAGNNTNEAEATAAMETANRLMAEYNISMASVEAANPDADQVRTEEKFKAKRARMTWARSIWNTVSEINFCRFWYETGWRGTEPDKFTVIGTRANVVTVQLMAEYLTQTIERLAAHTYRNANDRRAFSLGCARRVSQRLRDDQQRRVREDADAKRYANHLAAVAGTGTALVLANVYEQHRIANQMFMSQHHPHLKLTTRSGPTTNLSVAFNRGYAAGNTVGLTPQVGRSGRLLK
jgi:Protein of unknown function (DUF2786)